MLLDLGKRVVVTVILTGIIFRRNEPVVFTYAAF